MAFRKMRRRFRRPKKRLAWVGAHVASNFQLDEATGLSTAFELIPPASLTEGELQRADMTLLRVLLGFSVIQNQNLISTNIGLYLGVIETNNVDNPLANPVDWNDEDYYTKRDVMQMWNIWLTGTLDEWVGTQPYPLSAQGSGYLLNHGNPYDIRVKRRMRGEEGLYIVARAQAEPTGEIDADASITLWYRALVSLGRK